MASTTFEMTVMDLFRFGDGRTVLVGPVVGPSDLVRPCDCQLLVEGVLRNVVRIEGEMLPAQKEVGHRAFSTRDSISLTRDEASAVECLLRCFAE
jgi:hypothetical protein